MDDAIARCKYLFDAVLEDGIELRMINLGGGFPASYVDPHLFVMEYADGSCVFYPRILANTMPESSSNPVAPLVDDAGVIVSEVVNISRKSKNNMYQWVYLDIGKFGGLIETIDESIKFPIYFERQG
jgi:ornithine decarboxylase